jgi:hypothetical protein
MPYKDPIKARNCSREVHARRNLRKRLRYISDTRAWLGKVTSPDPIDAAWAAGIFEGEGTVTISSAGRRNHGSYGRIVCTLTNTDFQMVKIFDNLWKPKNLLTHNPSGSRNARLSLVWKIEGDHAWLFMRDILPFVKTDRVREKLLLAMAAQKSKRERTSQGLEYRKEQLAFRQRMRELNRRGRRDSSEEAVILDNDVGSSQAMLPGLDGKTVADHVLPALEANQLPQLTF